MVNRTFQYTYIVYAPASQIYEHLADPNSYMGLSPLLISVSDIQWSTNPQGQRCVRYKSIELFKFLGLISYRNHLKVVMTLSKPNQQIISDVESQQSVTVRFIFDFEEQAGHTVVTETITATMPALFSRFVIGQAKSVQQNRAKVLKQRMEHANKKGE